jgi:molybdopterin synthase catalytic subunit
MMITIVAKPIDVQEVLRSVAHPSAGGIDIFLGTTRDHSLGRGVAYLEYEVYEPMARKVMEEIAANAAARWQLHKVSIVHRSGRVGIGEASVVIAVSSSHRREAFEACRYCIDTLKQTVPIWKKEVFSDGSVEWAGTHGEKAGGV